MKVLFAQNITFTAVKMTFYSCGRQKCTFYGSADTPNETHTKNYFSRTFSQVVDKFDQKWINLDLFYLFLVQNEPFLIQIALCIVVLCRHIEEFTGSRNFFHFFEPLLVQKCHFPSQNPVHIGI